MVSGLRGVGRDRGLDGALAGGETDELERHPLVQGAVVGEPHLTLATAAAVDAGLGEIGRLGLLITPTHGPRVRLAADVDEVVQRGPRQLDVLVNAVNWMAGRSQMLGIEAKELRTGVTTLTVAQMHAGRWLFLVSAVWALLAGIVAIRQDRIVVAVDPPASGHAGSDECGIVVVGAVKAQEAARSISETFGNWEHTRPSREDIPGIPPLTERRERRERERWTCACPNDGRLLRPTPLPVPPTRRSGGSSRACPYRH